MNKDLELDHAYSGITIVINNTIIPELLSEIKKLQQCMEKLESDKAWFCRKCYKVCSNDMIDCERICYCDCCNSKKYCKPCAESINIFYTECEICCRQICSSCDPLVLEDGQPIVLEDGRIDDVDGWTCSECSL